jgi:glycosyltransferase involved in cell wall biosynthesis
MYTASGDAVVELRGNSIFSNRRLRLPGKSIHHYTESLAGGVLTSLQYLCAAQVASGYSVTLVYLTRANTPHRKSLESTFSGVTLVNLGRSSIVGFLRLLLFEVRRRMHKGKGLAHSHSSWAGFLIRIIPKKDKLPIFHTPHGYAFLMSRDSSIPQNIFVIVEKFLGKLPGRVTLACGDSELKFAKKLGIEQPRLLGNFLEDPLMTIDSSPHLMKGDKKELIIASVGRVTRQKNPMKFIEVVDSLETKCKALWIGSGDPLIENELRNSGIMVTGWIEKELIHEYFLSLDVFVMTSSWEGLPMTAIEAMAYGKPIVCTRFDGVEDLITNGLNGFICEDPQDAGKKIDLLLRNSKLRSEVGELGRSLFKEKFDYKILAKNWELAYGLSN